jgi:hypothetical protein
MERLGAMASAAAALRAAEDGAVVPERRDD